MPFIGLPRLQMVARRQQVEAAMLRPIADLDQFGYRELLVRQHIPDHPFALQTTAGAGRVPSRLAGSTESAGRRRKPSRPLPLP